MRTVHALVVLVLLNIAVSAASKPHVISFGKPQPVKLFVGASETKTMDITVVPLFVDAKLKEFTTGKSARRHRPAVRGAPGFSHQ